LQAADTLLQKQSQIPPLVNFKLLAKIEVSRRCKGKKHEKTLIMRKPVGCMIFHWTMKNKTGYNTFADIEMHSYDR